MRFHGLLNLFIWLLGSGVAAAGAGGEHGHGHGGDAIRITTWDQRYEVFAEHPPVIAQEPTEFVVHLTRLADGGPRTSGPLTFHCQHEQGALYEETADAPARPGIYEAELRFPAHGTWRVTLVFPTGAGEERLVLPPVQAHATAAAVTPVAEPPAGISFLKEQQWPIAMLTAPAAKRTLGRGDVLAIPSSAVIQDNQLATVFVQLDGETFAMRHPVLGESNGTYVQVISGVDPGERVVSRGAAAVLAASHAGADSHGHDDHEIAVEMDDADVDRYSIALITAAAGQIHAEIEVPGEIALNGHKTAQIVALVPGMVGDVAAALGDEVRAGQVVATLNCRELADAKSSYLAAVQREELAAANFAREEGLFADKISSDQEFIEARHALSEARILARAARQKLVTMGLGEPAILDLESEPDSLLTRFEIRAPFAGSIIERSVELGEVVGADAPLFKVADLRTVWLNLHVPAREIRRIRTGQAVTLVSPDDVRGVRGSIEYVHPIVDERSRTVLVRATLANDGGLLRSGLFVTARVAAEMRTAPVVVPKDAIQYLNDEPVVFVRESTRFVVRSVVLGGANGDRVALTAGLEPGERLATRNSFLLKSEVEKRTSGEVGHGHAH